MANDFKYTVENKSVWNRNTHAVEVYFSLPDDEILEKKRKVGILLLVAGFGGEANSSVYKKMRNLFADKYNLAVIQCDYYGSEYMGKSLANELNEKANSILERPFDLLSENQWKDIKKKNGYVCFKSESTQSESCQGFCDMSIDQAMDCITSVKSVIDMLENIGVEVDENMILSYGFSHGAYLSYIMNRLFPNLFSALIDNSAWLYPKYLYSCRELTTVLDMRISIDNELCEVKLPIKAIQEYHASQWIDDMEVLDIRNMYNGFNNKANIISYHGTDDSLVTIDEKINFLNNLSNVEINVITPEDIDNKVFYNASHGLGANFVEFFDYIYTKHELKRANNDNIWEKENIESSKYTYMPQTEGEYVTLIRKEKVNTVN